MSIIVTVRIPGVSEERFRAVEQSHPELGVQLRQLSRKHGLISHQRLIRDREVLDIDEWESEAGVSAFLLEADPVISELARLRGASKPEGTIWRRY